MSATKADASADLMNELRALIASGGAMGALDERKVRAVVEDMKEAHSHVESIAANPYANMTEPYYASSMRYYHAKCIRDKKCLVTYLQWRQRQVSEAWWRTQDNLLRPSLAPAEEKYLEDYNEVMVEYMTSFAIPLDLRAFLWRPPSVQQLEVRGIKDYVFVSPITGSTITIYPGSQIFLNFEEVEPLLQQGVVELVSC